MYTAEIIRRQQMQAHYRLLACQKTIVRGFEPIAKLWAEKMREVYPELFPPQSPDPGQAVKG